MKYYAHTKESANQDEWQLLTDHLNQTANMAKKFSAEFDACEFGEICGLFHDLGKYSQAFQNYLKGDGKDHRSMEERDHSTAGAQFCNSKQFFFTKMLAFIIAGHHSGLLDWENGSNHSLRIRLEKKIPDWKCSESETMTAQAHFPQKLPNQMMQYLRDVYQSKKGKSEKEREMGWELSLFTRMLFSSLVDADYLDTERFMNETIFNSRPQWPGDILKIMNDILEKHLTSFQSDSYMGQIRKNIRLACDQAAELTPGFFTLTVPTGGGKTLSSLSFALKHALKYEKKRIVYVVPYISIIEQNAEVFKKVFSELKPNPVLEVHSNLEYSENQKDDTQRSLASENFDAPLVVTTAVQFYESFFACRSSSCRKLHNISNSVIIFDEVQKVPIEYLSPIIRLWKSLAEFYHCTLVLCTATQPEIWENEFFRNGLPESWKREIIPAPDDLFRRMKRTEITFLGQMTDSDLVNQLNAEKIVLCIVNTISHAIEIFRMLESEEGNFCLTTRLYAQQRIQCIREIKKRLKQGLSCRVISTSLVEAGVDLDFPVVYRSSCGLDSVAQAAGRCNREGKNKDFGQVRVFQSEHDRRETYLNREKGLMNEMQQTSSINHTDILSPEIISGYFVRYYKDQNSDKKLILHDFLFDGKVFNFMYEEADRKFHMIGEDSSPIVIPVPEIEGVVEQIRNSPIPDYRLIRQLQRYTVNLRIERIKENLANGNIESYWNGAVLLLTSTELHYNPQIGLNFDSRPDGIYI